MSTPSPLDAPTTANTNKPPSSARPSLHILVPPPPTQSPPPAPNSSAIQTLKSHTSRLLDLESSTASLILRAADTAASYTYRLESLDEKCESLDEKTDSLDERTESLDERMETLGHAVQNLQMQVEGLGEGQRMAEFAVWANEERVRGLELEHRQAVAAASAAVAAAVVV